MQNGKKIPLKLIITPKNKINQYTSSSETILDNQKNSNDETGSQLLNDTSQLKHEKKTIYIKTNHQLDDSSFNVLL